MERIAIISDIHGNLEALKVVIEDIKKRNITKVFCLGDIVSKGVNAKECVDLVRKTCEVVIKGNGEAKLERGVLPDKDTEYLKNLPFSHEFYMSGSLVRLMHATPEDIKGFCISLDKVSHKYKMFLPSKNTPSGKVADVLIYGHIHMPNLERLYHRTLINAGSVGSSVSLIYDEDKNASSMETTKATYLILEGEYNSKVYSSLSFQFVNLVYDINKVILNQEKNLGWKSQELLYGKYHNVEKFKNSLKERNIDI